MSTTYSKAAKNRTELSNPFSSERTFRFPNFTDMSDWMVSEAEPLRVELRRLYEPAMGEVEYVRKLVGKVPLVGICEEADLPHDGEVFELHYHSCDGLSDFGVIESSYPVTDVERQDNYYYFTTPECAWRLELLDSGN